MDDLRQPIWPISETLCGKAIWSHDWAGHPLGPVAQWPQSLRALVASMLDCSYALIVLWGRDLFQIYNDPYAEIMGDRHPAGLGQKTAECWPEVWDFNEQIYKRVFAG